MMAINKLKRNLSAGPDSLLPLFKRVKNSISAHLSLIYQQLISVAHVPDEWKMAIITPDYLTY